MKLEDLKDYKLVWADEFDGNELDPKKWCFFPMMGRSKRPDGSLVYDLASDEKVIKVDDGTLKLNVYYDYERGTFVGPISPSTKDSMSFTYGYVEMRARVPYTHGSWASFWTLGRDAIGQDKTIPYFSEIDIFEINGTTHCAVPCLHKWHTDPAFQEKGRPNNDSFAGSILLGKGHPDNRYARITPEDTVGYNIYGFLWTPEKIEFYLNGRLYAHFNIVENYGRDSGMKGFHTPQYFILNNYLLVDSQSQARPVSIHATPGDVATQIPYEIDYIRLYQKDGEGELNLAQE
ncbi:MAG: glycoside hydrolase family 16 protein [Clostridia bacterium]|nr:glycoside hydrolase family 16 protein [Clostridia bacterium]